MSDGFWQKTDQNVFVRRRQTAWNLGLKLRGSVLRDVGKLVDKVPNGKSGRKISDAGENSGGSVLHFVSPAEFHAVFDSQTLGIYS